MKRPAIVIVCGTTLLIAAVGVVVASRNRWQPLPPPEAATARSPAEVRVKAVERKAEPVEQNVVAVASGAVAIVCGGDTTTADRYEARNDALRSISRRRDLSQNDVAMLMEYLRSTNDVMRAERVAALKNDVMNLLRIQSRPPEGFAETLVAMFDGGRHPPAVLDYCIQHLGAMLGDIAEGGLKSSIRSTLVGAARQVKQPYSGTALYSLAEDTRASQAQKDELRRLALALCRPDANGIARIAAIQLAGERGYAEVLPLLRETLSSPRRDAVTDIVCIGSIGLLGSSADLPLLERFARLDRRRAVAAETAIRRIKEKGGNAR